MFAVCRKLYPKSPQSAASARSAAFATLYGAPADPLPSENSPTLHEPFGAAFAATGVTVIEDNVKTNTVIADFRNTFFLMGRSYLLFH
jgi:hypothetical protein